MKIYSFLEQFGGHKVSYTTILIFEKYKITKTMIFSVGQATPKFPPNCNKK